jgi:hypothetical protein
VDKEEVHKAIKRRQLQDNLEQDFLASINDRISRYLELDFIQVVPNTHFAPITIECILLYRDGYFFACIALCQAVAEAMLRFMCERNDRGSKGLVKFETNIRNLRELKDKIPLDWIETLERVWKNRNDYHHLNPDVPTQKEKLREIAKDKIVALLDVESKVFAFEWVDGAIKRTHPEYWLETDSGHLNSYLRFEL